MRRSLVRFSGQVSQPAFVISTPIFYPNASPHVGHLHSLVLADVIARFHALRNPAQKIIFSTGTDEHGLKIQHAAKAAGRKEAEFCAEIAGRFKDLATSHAISHSVFVRTSESRHKQVATALWNILVKNGHIYKSTHAGWYSITDECFYPETKIRNGRSVETGSLVEWSSEVNYKFALSAFRTQLLEWLTKNDAVILPRSRQIEVINELEADSVLPDLSVSRPVSRLHWGVPVPPRPSAASTSSAVSSSSGPDQVVDTEECGQTMYVWLEALANYLTVTGWPDNPNAWPADVHVVGKDIMRFHAIYWPAFLLAAGLPLPKQIVSHGHWLNKNVKMSKSIGNVMDPYVAGATVGVDGLRYFLLRAGGSLATDSSFDIENLERYYRVELKNQLGNLTAGITSEIICSRTSRYSQVQHASLQKRVQSGEFSQLNSLVQNFTDLPSSIIPALKQREFGRVLENIMQVLSQANSVHTQIRPWSKETEEDLAQASLYCSREVLRIAGILLQPIMPHKMLEMLSLLEVPDDSRSWEDAIQCVPSKSYTPQKAKLFP